jgi:hypothetical protein
MAGHSRSKNGVASLAYVPAIHAFSCGQDVDARHEAGHDELSMTARQQKVARAPSCRRETVANEAHRVQTST